jgi:hypothetical protein
MFTRGITVTLTGSAGSATGSTTIDVPNGRLVAVAADFASQPATLDTTIASTDTPVTTYLTLTDTNADFGWTDLFRDGIDAAGAAETAFPQHPPVLSGSLTVSAAGGDAGDMTVWVAIEPVIA